MCRQFEALRAGRPVHLKCGSSHSEEQPLSMPEEVSYFARCRPVRSRSPHAAPARKPEKGKLGTRRTAVFLPDDQIEWLKAKPKGIPSTIRALITETMNLENLARSVKKRR